MHSLRSHTGGLRSVFCEVHAPAKNDLISFSPCAAKNSARHMEVIPTAFPETFLTELTERNDIVEAKFAIQNFFPFLSTN